MLISLSHLDFENAPFRVPFKFGAATIRELVVAHVVLQVSVAGGEATGTGSMPLGNAWSFPGVDYTQSLDAMQQIVEGIARRIAQIEVSDNIISASLELRHIAFEVTADI